MSELAEVFNAMKDSSKRKRQFNRESSLQYLQGCPDIGVEVKNWGVHLIVHRDHVTADFWPGTGKFILRDCNIKGRGVFNLVKRLREAI